jgi:hypothetical protein
VNEFSNLSISLCQFKYLTFKDVASFLINRRYLSNSAILFSAFSNSLERKQISFLNIVDFSFDSDLSLYSVSSPTLSV